MINILAQMSSLNNNNNAIGITRYGGDGPPHYSSRRIAGSTSYFDPSLKGLSNKETMQFEIVQFASLKHESGEYFFTDPILCHGQRWKLKIFPKGEDDYSEEKWMSCFLLCCDASPDNLVKAEWTVHVNRSILAADFVDEDDDEQYAESYVDAYSNLFDDEDDEEGAEQTITYEDAISKFLNKQGSLVIDVDIQVYGKSPTWYPGSRKEKFPPPGKHYLDSSVGKDISFLVGFGDGGTDGSSAMTTQKNESSRQPQPQTFDAHKCILLHRAPGLYEFIKDTPAGESFELKDIANSTFQILLEYIYTGKYPQIEIGIFDDDDSSSEGGEEEGSGGTSSVIEHAKSCILAADKFNLILLKLQIESEITSKLLNPHNAAEWLPFADAYSCPLLKEACMDIYADHLLEVKNSSQWKAVKESSDLLEELLEYYAMGKRIPRSCTDYDKMSVRALREELESQDLELDGTREMLIRRLKEHQTALSNAEHSEGDDEVEVTTIGT